MEIFEVRFRTEKNGNNIGVQLCTTLQAAKDFAESLPPIFCEVWINVLSTNNDEYFSYSQLANMYEVRNNESISIN